MDEVGRGRLIPDVAAAAGRAAADELAAADGSVAWTAAWAAAWTAVDTAAADAAGAGGLVVVLVVVWLRSAIRAARGVSISTCSPPPSMSASGSSTDMADAPSLATAAIAAGEGGIVPFAVASATASGRSCRPLLRSAIWASS